MLKRSTLFVVDDEASITNAVAKLANLWGLSVEVYHSAEDFLASYDSARPGCLVLDYCLPGRSGFDLQNDLEALHSPLPIIMISGRATVELAVTAMAGGVVTFLEKPFSATALFRAVEEGLVLDAARRRAMADASSANARIASLTSKEREVLALVAAGRSNSQIADALGRSGLLKTVVPE